MSKPLALTWALSTISGYGIYGLQIAQQFFLRGGEKFIPTHQPAAMMLPALTQLRLNSIFDLARKIAAVMQENPNENLRFDHPVLHAVGNDCAGFAGQDRVWGKPNVGCAAIEHKIFSSHAREIAKGYDMFIAISRWNEQFLRELNIGPVHLCYQGIDKTLFYPGARTGLWSNRFIVFSGGKFEFRKGQDIVTAAFKIFQAKYPEALLVTAWQNVLPIDPTPYQLAGHCQTVPQPAPDVGIQITPWLLQQGLPPGSFVELPYTPNMLMPFVLRECDVALFPNRCEGGTNLVAMEAMACGVPTFVANNTGQKDLVELFGCGGLMDQKSVKPAPDMASAEDWGESNVDEVVAALELIYTQREAAKRAALAVAAKIQTYEWSSLNEKLLHIVCD